jgi:hypothetical protein
VALQDGLGFKKMKSTEIIGNYKLEMVPLFLKGTSMVKSYEQNMS